MNNILETKSYTDNSLVKPAFFSKGIVNPKRDWGILITLFIVFVLFAVGFDYYMYQKVVSGDMYVSINREDVIVENLDTKDLQKISNDFDAKINKTMTLKLEKLVDPSI